MVTFIIGCSSGGELLLGSLGVLAIAETFPKSLVADWPHRVTIFSKFGYEWPMAGTALWEDLPGSTSIEPTELLDDFDPRPFRDDSAVRK